MRQSSDDEVIEFFLVKVQLVDILDHCWWSFEDLEDLYWYAMWLFL